jgi:hypothetical protein
MKKILYSLICLCFAFANLAGQQSKVVDRIIELGKTDNRTMHHLDVLTNRFGGRITGSDAYTNAAQWCASEFKKWGMEVIMDEAGTLPVGFDRGPVLIEPKSRDEFEHMKGALKGAWVLISGKNTGWPIDFSQHADSLRAKVLVYNDSISKLNREITRQNYENRDKPPKDLMPLKEEPALFYHEMCEAGILGVIQSAAVPIRVLYDRKKLPKISNYFNRDGGPTVASGLNVPEAMYDDFEKICKPLSDINPDFPFKLVKNTQPPRPRPITAGGSDHAYFAMNGVPTLAFDESDSKGYDFNYGEIWHTENDYYNKSIPEYQEHTSIVTAVVVYGLANLDHLLSRKGLYAEPDEKK